MGIKAAIVLLAGIFYIRHTYALMVFFCTLVMIFAVGNDFTAGIFKENENKMVMTLYGERNMAILLGELRTGFKGVVEEV